MKIAVFQRSKNAETFEKTWKKKKKEKQNKRN